MKIERMEMKMEQDRYEDVEIVLAHDTGGLRFHIKQGTDIIVLSQDGMHQLISGMCELAEAAETEERQLELLNQHSAMEQAITEACDAVA